MALRRPPALDVALAAALTVLVQLELWLGETYEGKPAFPGDRAATAVLLLGVTCRWRGGECTRARRSRRACSRSAS
jgi:hypothetical protein